MANESPEPNNAQPESVQRAKAKKLDVQLPYMNTPGTVKTALDRIRDAAAPERLNTDFINTILKMKGGTGAAVIPFLKRIGLVASDGSPTDLYRKFRNTSTGGAAIAAAIKHGYKPLADSREYFYKLDDKELLNLIIEVTGADPKSSTAKQILYTLNALREYADFDSKSIMSVGEQTLQDAGQVHLTPTPTQNSQKTDPNEVSLRLAYTINLNLPATSDQSVFNAIFRSLKEHLISYGS